MSTYHDELYASSPSYRRLCKQVDANIAAQKQRDADAILGGAYRNHKARLAEQNRQDFLLSMVGL